MSAPGKNRCAAASVLPLAARARACFASAPGARAASHASGPPRLSKNSSARASQGAAPPAPRWCGRLRLCPGAPLCLPAGSVCASRNAAIWGPARSASRVRLFHRHAASSSSTSPLAEEEASDAADDSSARRKSGVARNGEEAASSERLDSSPAVPSVSADPSAGSRNNPPTAARRTGEGVENGRGEARGEEARFARKEQREARKRLRERKVASKDPPGGSAAAPTESRRERSVVPGGLPNVHSDRKSPSTSANSADNCKSPPGDPCSDSRAAPKPTSAAQSSRQSSTDHGTFAVSLESEDGKTSTKQPLRERPANFTRPDATAPLLAQTKTSGSSSKPFGKAAASNTVPSSAPPLVQGSFAPNPWDAAELPQHENEPYQDATPPSFPPAQSPSSLPRPVWKTVATDTMPAKTPSNPSKPFGKAAASDARNSSASPLVQSALAPNPQDTAELPKHANEPHEDATLPSFTPAQSWSSSPRPLWNTAATDTMPAKAPGSPLKPFGGAIPSSPPHLTKENLVDDNWTAAELRQAAHEPRQDRAHGRWTVTEPPCPADKPSDAPRYREIVINKIPWDYEEQDLRDMFAKVGSVCQVFIPRERGCSRGFAYVTFATQAEAQKAVETMDMTDCGGRRIAVKMSHRDEVVPEVYGLRNVIRVHPLPPNVSRASLVGLFGTYGTVVGCSIPKSDFGFEQNFALVAMLEEAGARAAVRHLHKTSHCNTQLNVCILRPSDHSFPLRSVTVRSAKNPDKVFVDRLLVTDDMTISDVVAHARLPAHPPTDLRYVFRGADGAELPYRKPLARMVTFTEHLDVSVSLEGCVKFNWNDL